MGTVVWSVSCDVASHEKHHQLSNPQGLEGIRKRALRSLFKGSKVWLRHGGSCKGEKRRRSGKINRNLQCRLVSACFSEWGKGLNYSILLELRTVTIEMFASTVVECFSHQDKIWTVCVKVSEYEWMLQILTPRVHPTSCVVWCEVRKMRCAVRGLSRLYRSQMPPPEMWCGCTKWYWSFLEPNMSRLLYGSLEDVSGYYRSLTVTFLLQGPGRGRPWQHVRTVIYFRQLSKER